VILIALPQDRCYNTLRSSGTGLNFNSKHRPDIRWSLKPRLNDLKRLLQRPIEPAPHRGSHAWNGLF
jgi:hypothetical protein